MAFGSLIGLESGESIFNHSQNIVKQIQSKCQLMRDA